MNHHELITSKELAPLFIEVATKMIARGLCERNKLPQDSLNKFVGDLLQSQKALIDALTKMNIADSEIEQIANKGVIYYQHQVFLSPGQWQPNALKLRKKGHLDVPNGPHNC